MNDKSCQPVRADGADRDQLRDENRQLREIFDTAAEEFTKLRGQVRMLEDELAREKAKSKALNAECARLEKEREKAQARANKFGAMLFAVKSEKLKIADIDIGADAVVVESATAEVIQEGTGTEAPPAVEPAPQGPPAEEEKKRRGAQKGHAGRGRKIPDNLTEEEVRVELPALELGCPACGKPCVEKPGLEVVSYQVTVRKQYLLRKFVRVSYQPVCTCDKLATIITAPPPVQLIPKGKYSEDIWADFLIAKFMSHQPVNRQLFEMVQANINIKPGTVFSGLAKIYVDYLKPLQEALLLELRLANHWHADETRWRMFLEGCKTMWYMWGYRSSEIVAFVLDPTRAAGVPLKTLFNLDIETIGIDGLELDTTPLELPPEMLKIINVDRYSAYKTLMRFGLVLLAYCWAHVRRDFSDVKIKYPDLLNLGQWADSWRLKIANLYHINNERVKHPQDGESFREYNAKLRVAIQEFRQAIDEPCAHDAHDAQVKVMASLKVHWGGLTLFVDHPEIPMDNNYMENDLRTIALGRNNFLGTHSRWGGDLAACMYSIIKTCLLNDIEPKAYLLHYFHSCMANRGMDTETARNILPHKISGELKEKLRLRKF
ncbi:MAG: transposase [bacterium]